MELIRFDENYANPGTSDTFIKACRALNADLDKFRDAQIAELKYQIQYLQENFAKSGIKDYGLSDPMGNIENLVYQLFPEKKSKNV